MNVSVYRRLCDDHSDPLNYMVFADSLEDDGLYNVAGAYRWAAKNHCRWPFERTEYMLNARKKRGDPVRTVRDVVYDWNEYHDPPPTVMGEPVPLEALLPRELFLRYVLLPNKVFSAEPHAAFMILGRMLFEMEPAYPTVDFVLNLKEQRV